jgi:mono/diheme cytochrome c family protein
MKRSGAPLWLTLWLTLPAACDRQGNLDLERMLDQHKYEPYEASPLFADGRIMRRPPEGTVARDALLGPPALVEGMRAGDYLAEVPVAVTRQSLERGRNRFEIFCGLCHGLAGTGESQVAENMRLRPPPSLHDPRIRAYPPGRLYRVIARGYGLMPAYANQLPVADRWAVVAYVQVLQSSQAVPLAALPAALQKEASRWLK